LILIRIYAIVRLITFKYWLAMRKKIGLAVLAISLILAGIGFSAFQLSSGNYGVGLVVLAVVVVVALDLGRMYSGAVWREARRDAFLAGGLAAGAAGSSVFMTETDPVSTSVPGDSYFDSAFSEVEVVNPATGIPMVGGGSGLDFTGNVYGVPDGIGHGDIAGGCELAQTCDPFEGDSFEAGNLDGETV
jgi:hypothetical protein